MRILKVVESSHPVVKSTASKDQASRQWLSSAQVHKNSQSSGSISSGSSGSKSKWSTRKRSMELMRPITTSSSCPQLSNLHKSVNASKLYPNRTSKYFSWVFRSLCFLLTLTSLCLISSALFTGHWVEEKAQVWRMVTLEADHGLYKICVKVRYNKKLSFFTKPKHLDPDDPKMGIIDACINRFESQQKIQIFPVIDQILDFFRRSLIAWEIAVLIMICLSTILTFLCSTLYWFLCKNYGLILAAGQLVAGMLTLAVLVTYTVYHGTKSMGKISGPLLSFFVQQSYDFGYSYNVAIGACVCQFFTFFVIFCVSTFSACRRRLLYHQNATV